MNKFLRFLMIAVTMVTLTVASYAANSISFTTHPSTTSPANVILTTQPVVTIVKSGNMAGQSVVLTLATTPNGSLATISGTTTLLTNASGIATFTDIKVNADIVGTYTITATWGGLSTTSNNIIITALPVELTSFTAVLKGTFVTLNWKTATETNNYGFQVERKDGTWVFMGFQLGAGTTSSPKEYSFTDRTANGTVQYRLKQIDRDGAFKYSDVIEVTVITPQVFALNQNYPNPFNPSTTIGFSIPINSSVSLKIYNIIGQEVQTVVNEILQAGNYSRIVNMDNLSSGMYFYRLTAGNFTEVKKLALIK